MGTTNDKPETMFSVLLLTSAALVSAQLNLGALDLSAITGITVANGVATVDAAVTLDAEGSIDNMLKVTNDAVLTIASTVQVKSEVVIEKGSTIVVKDSNKLVADKVTCGSADGKGSLTIENGSTLMINKQMDLKADTCTVTAGQGTLLFASEAQAKSTIAAGTYTVGQVEAQGKSEVETTGDVVVEGAITLRGNAQMKAKGALKANDDIVMQGNAKLQSSGKAAVEATSVQMDGSTTYVARYEQAASASADAALKASGNCKFGGDLMIDAAGGLKDGDEFVIATYDSFEGEFKSAVSASASADANASAGRKRAEEEGKWTVDYGDKEATATYSGPSKEPTTTSASTLVLSAGAMLVTVAAFF